MKLPVSIAERIRQFVAVTNKEGFHVDSESARYGGISLMGTLGATWLLRPDGTFWDVDDDLGKPITPLAPEWHVAALRLGAQRHPWLAEIICPRPPAALACPSCNGSGDLAIEEQEATFICPACFGKGWRDSDA